MSIDELMIREPRVPLLNRIIFSVVFGLFFILILYISRPRTYDLLNSDDIIRVIVHLILLFAILVLSFVPIILRHYIHINFSESKIRHIYGLGLLTYHENWQDLIDLNYISVYKIGHYYSVNMWYENNKILNLFANKNYNDAVKTAFQIADKLQIELLDATIKGDHKWIDKATYSKTSQIIHL